MITVKRTSCLNYNITVPGGGGIQYDSCTQGYFFALPIFGFIGGGAVTAGVNSVLDGVTQNDNSTYEWVIDGVSYNGRQHAIPNVSLGVVVEWTLKVTSSTGIVINFRGYFKFSAIGALEWSADPSVIIASQSCGNCYQFNGFFGSSLVPTGYLWEFNDGQADETTALPAEHVFDPDTGFITRYSTEFAETPDTMFAEIYVNPQACTGGSGGSGLGTSDAVYSISDLLGTVVASGDFTTGLTQSVTLPDEGVYILDVDGEKYTIIDYCELLNCLKKLILKIFCQDEPSKCCENCDSEELNAIRHELNKLVAGYGMLFMAIYAERVSYVGLFDIDDCRLKRLQTIDKYIDDLKEIKSKCGPDCDESPNVEDCGSC